MTERLMDTQTDSLDTQVESIAGKLDALLASHARLQQENQFLRQRVSKLTLAKAKLLDKNRQASHMVKRIIGQLREEIA